MSSPSSDTSVNIFEASIKDQVTYVFKSAASSGVTLEKVRYTVSYGTSTNTQESDTTSISLFQDPVRNSNYTTVNSFNLLLATEDDLWQKHELIVNPSNDDVVDAGRTFENSIDNNVGVVSVTRNFDNASKIVSLPVNSDQNGFYDILYLEVVLQSRTGITPDTYILVDGTPNTLVSKFGNTTLEGETTEIIKISNPINTITGTGITFVNSTGSSSFDSDITNLNVTFVAPETSGSVNGEIKLGDIGNFINSFLTVGAALDSNILITDVSLTDRTWTPAGDFSITFDLSNAPTGYSPFYDENTNEFSLNLNALQVSISEVSNNALYNIPEDGASKLNPTVQEIVTTFNTDNDDRTKLFVYEDGSFINSDGAERKLKVNLGYLEILNLVNFLTTSSNVFTISINGRISTTTNTGEARTNDLRITHEEFIALDSFELIVTPPVRNIIISLIVLVVSVLSGVTLTIVGILKFR